jgi:hypothetical protein
MVAEQTFHHTPPRLKRGLTRRAFLTGASAFAATLALGGWLALPDDSRSVPAVVPGTPLEPVGAGATPAADGSPAAGTTPDARLMTRFSATDLICPQDDVIWRAPVADFVNFGTHPHGREGILRGTMHHAYCPVDGYHVAIPHIFEVYDPAVPFLVQVRSSWEDEAGGPKYVQDCRAALTETYGDLGIPLDIVFGFEELIDRYLGGQPAVEAAMARAEEERARGLEPGTLSPP